MGYGIPSEDIAKATLVKMVLKEPKALLQDKHKLKLAKVLVDLILFDYELGILKECIYSVEPSRPICTVMDAWIARNSTHSVEDAKGYLYQNSPLKSISGQPKNTSRAPVDHISNNPAVNSGVTGQPRNMDGEVKVEAAMDHLHRGPPANYVTEQPFDPRTLPPPDPEGSGEFVSVTQHVNPSSHIDDDENQLIKDSTQLGYRNPPEVKFQITPSNSAGYPPITSHLPVTSHPPVTSHYRPPGQMWVPRSTLPSTSITPSPSKGHKFDNTHLEVSSTSTLGQSQYANMHLQKELYHDTQLPNTVASSSNATTAGGPLSLPSVGNADGPESSTKFGSLSHHKYNRQKSTPTDASLFSEMTASAAGMSESNQLVVSDHSPIIAAVPLTDQPTPEGSQVPSTADSKFGKTNLHYLKNRFQDRRESTETMVQTGAVGSRPQPSSDYVNVEALPHLIQGISDNASKPPLGRSHLPSLRSKLEKTKEEIEKTVVAASKPGNYGNISDFPPYVSENPVALHNPRNKKPMAAPRLTTSANFAGSNTHSASSAFSSNNTYKLWQCAHCKMINEANNSCCETCKLPQGKKADRSYFCEFCQLLMYIPLRKELADTSCPRCKKVYESAF